MSAYLRRHAQALLYALGQLSRRPWSTFATVAIIAAMLLLPSLSLSLARDIEALAGQWDGDIAMTAFLKPTVAPARGMVLAAQWRAKPTVRASRYISPAEGLAEFERWSGVGALARDLKTNPLPAALEIVPDTHEAAMLKTLSAELRAAPEVEFVAADIQWAERLSAVLAWLERAAVLLGAVLAVAVALVVGNTVRAWVSRQYQEVEVLDLIGATPAFIERPFIYGGAVQGAAGGLLAWGMVALGRLVLHGPATALLGSYGVPAPTWMPAAMLGAALAFGGLILGALGAKVTVARYLKHLRTAST